MAKNKVERFFPREDDIAVVGLINKEVKVAFSVEKADYGFYVVRYELNDNLEGLKNTIRYKRIDLKEKDTKRNRLVFSNQEDAEREALSSYKELFNYIQEKNGNNTN
jgi:hypothetical protein